MSNSPVEIRFTETATGEVAVTLPDGEVLTLEPDGDDAYQRESALSKRIVAAVATKVLQRCKQTQQKTDPPFLNGEYLYTPVELATLLSLDPSTVRRMFLDEPGVIKLGREDRRDGKREYVTLRIPASVVQRVLHEKSNRRRDINAFALQTPHRRMQASSKGKGAR